MPASPARRRLGLLDFRPHAGAHRVALRAGVSVLVPLLVIAALQVGAELLVGRNYGVAMLCVTPLALLMGQAAQPRPPAELLFDRGVETIIGAVVGVVVVLAAHRLRSRRAVGR